MDTLVARVFSIFPTLSTDVTVYKQWAAELNSKRAATPVYLLNTFARYACSSDDRAVLLTQIWNEVHGRDPDPYISAPRLRKALTIFEHLLIHGPLVIYTSCRESQFHLDALLLLSTSFNAWEMNRHNYGNEHDIGSRVRQTASRLFQLLTDYDNFESSRAQAFDIKRIFIVNQSSR